MGDKRIRIEKSNIDEGKLNIPTTLNNSLTRFLVFLSDMRLRAVEFVQ